MVTRPARRRSDHDDRARGAGCAAPSSSGRSCARSAAGWSTRRAPIPRSRPRSSSCISGLAEMEPLQARVAELEERMDFTERLLAQSKDPERLAALNEGGVHGSFRCHRPRRGLPELLVKIFQAVGNAIAVAPTGAGTSPDHRCSGGGGRSSGPIGRGRGTIRFRRAAAGQGRRRPTSCQGECER